MPSLLACSKQEITNSLGKGYGTADVKPKKTEIHQQHITVVPAINVVVTAVVFNQSHRSDSIKSIRG
jgi:hypothetical protein